MLSLKPLPLSSGFWTYHHKVLCWLMECIRWIWFQYLNEGNLLPLIADHISSSLNVHHVNFQGFVLNPPVSCSVAARYFVCWTWWPLFEFFTQSISCDVLIGWICSGDWQSRILCFCGTTVDRNQRLVTGCWFVMSLSVRDVNAALAQSVLCAGWSGTVVGHWYKGY